MRMQKRLLALLSWDGANWIAVGSMLLIVTLYVAFSARANLNQDPSVFRWVPYALAEAGAGFGFWLFFCGFFRCVYSLSPVPFPRSLYLLIGMLSVGASATSLLPLSIIVGRAELLPLIGFWKFSIIVGTGAGMLIVLFRDRPYGRNRDTGE
mgnify:CR=1 FL=1